MKNVHIIPTDNYSPLVYSTNKYGGIFLSKYYSPMKNMGDSYQNIYITNDEEIKEGDWFIQVNLNKIIKHHSKNGFLLQPQSFDKKIILTTDQELIKDGVQAIDDTFLEWFVKNPSCEEVEIDKGYRGIGLFNYKIIIPKEEPKQEKDDSYIKEQKERRRKLFNLIDELEEKKLQEEPKQETLEEAAEKYADFSNDYVPLAFGSKFNETTKRDFKEGAKWQAKRMYSEEEVLEIVSNCDGSISQAKKWFEQFKNK